jgi:hydrogenase expression/formation protein HypC
MYSSGGMFNAWLVPGRAAIPVCLGIPARVVSLEGPRATLDLRGRRIVADASMVAVSPGDYVLSYAGLIVQVLSREEAEETLRLVSMAEEASVPPS